MDAVTLWGEVLVEHPNRVGVTAAIGVDETSFLAATMRALDPAARAVADRVGPCRHVLAVDRSAKAIAQLTETAGELIATGRLTPRLLAAEALEQSPTRTFLRRR